MSETENEVKDSHVSESPSKITAWWNKFHFSGRVIMCSVLFGLGLVLIGGLIFAINVDDDTQIVKDESKDQLPTKAPSNYVGPVVMGIGGFIVIVGVVMCLFETQVCRKKTGDAKPLISDKNNEDSETKLSDSTTIPSSSHSHKNHKHKSRKIASSPRKTKSKHAKSPSREQKQASSKSPPISIDKSKSFMTSSEEKFLTPPNEPPELLQSNSREAEIQTSSSLMQSFSSSGPSWNQSTEFLTPTASFNDNSITVDDSVELNEKQGMGNFKTNEESGHTRAEFMTPFPTEEERIQKMFTQVKNEHMKTSKVQSDENESTENLGIDHGNDTSVINSKDVKKTAEDIQISKNDLPLDVNFNSSVIEKTSDKLALLDNKSKIDNKVNTFSKDLSDVSNVPPEKLMFNENKNGTGSADMTARINEKENDTKMDIHASHEFTVVTRSEEGNVLTEEKEKLAKGTEKLDSFIPSDSQTYHINETKNIQKFDLESPNDNINEIALDVDLESSASSEETLISRDSSIEKPKDNNAHVEVSMAEGNSSDKFKTSDDSESLKKDPPSSNHGISDHRDSLTNISKEEKVEGSDLTDSENNLKEAKNIDEKLTEESS